MLLIEEVTGRLKEGDYDGSSLLQTTSGKLLLTEEQWVLGGTRSGIKSPTMVVPGQLVVASTIAMGVVVVPAATPPKVSVELGTSQPQ